MYIFVRLLAAFSVPFSAEFGRIVRNSEIDFTRVRAKSKFLFYDRKTYVDLSFLLDRTIYAFTFGFDLTIDKRDPLDLIRGGFGI